MSKEKTPLVSFAGHALNKETGHTGVLLVIEHSSEDVVAAAASYLIEVVGPSMEKGLPAIEQLFRALRGDDPDGALERFEAVTKADDAAAAINDAEPTAEAKAEADVFLRSIMGANPGASGKQ